METKHLRDGARRGNFRLLQPPQAYEFAMSRTPADQAFQSRSPPRIKFQVISLALEFEPPDLAIPTILQKRPHSRQIPQELLQRLRRHAGGYMRHASVCLPLVPLNPLSLSSVSFRRMG